MAATEPSPFSRTLGARALQFGQADRAEAYPDRPAAFGIAERDGCIALARITRPDQPPYVDLPGGGIDDDEAAEDAVVREFGEETGLIVRVIRPIMAASQYLIRNDGQPANNRAAHFEVEVTGFDEGLKIEADHALVWVAPDEAVRTLRHDSHAWAVAAWLRQGQNATC